MLRLLSLIFVVPLLLVLVLFAISNPQPAQLLLWPLDLAWEVPLAGAVLGAAALAFLLGTILAWGGALRYRNRARRLQNTTQKLEAELATLRARTAPPGPPAIV